MPSATFSCLEWGSLEFGSLVGVLPGSGPKWELYRVRVSSRNILGFGSRAGAHSGPERELVQVPSRFPGYINDIQIFAFFFSFEEGSGNIFLKMF